VIYVHVKSTGHTEQEDTMEELMKEIEAHTLIGDVQEMGMAGFGKAAIRKQLKSRYTGKDEAMTGAEFEAILSAEFAKVASWLREQAR
jgi:hypothetical protein